MSKAAMALDTRSSSGGFDAVGGAVGVVDVDAGVDDDDLVMANLR